METLEYIDFLTVKRQGGKLTLLFEKTDFLDDLLDATSAYTGDGFVPYGKEVEVKGLYEDYTKVFCGSIGELGVPYLFLLTKEGRIEYVNVLACFKAGYFCASGPLLGISDVKDFEAYVSGDGFQTVCAITKAGERIDLQEEIWLDMGNSACALLDCTWGTSGRAEGESELFLKKDSEGHLSFEKFDEVPGEEYRIGLTGSLTYLGMTEKGAIYFYEGYGAHSNSAAWQGAVALYVESSYNGDEWVDTLYVTELGGYPLLGGKAGDVTALSQTFG